MPDLEELFLAYSQKKSEIKKRLTWFERVWENGGNKRIFSELCFCILTPQSGAFACDAAIKRCLPGGAIFFGNQKELESRIFPVRFYKNKSKYIIEARNFFSNSKKIMIKDLLSEQNMQLNQKHAREWLVKNVKGLGYKEASHFIRNIGFGKGLCILDRHVLKNLKRLGVIKSLPKTLPRKKYFEIEEKMLAFSKKIGIPAEELDLLLWSQQTGVVFK